MSRYCRGLVLSVTLLFAMAGTALAQAPEPASSGGGDGWKVTVYPILAWVPLQNSIDVNLPPVEGGGGGGGDLGGKIVDPRFDGAFLGGFSVARGDWRIDFDGLWAAVGGDRPSLPQLTVDVDLIYVHATGGRRVYKDLYVTAGVRRLALNYDIKLGDLPDFSRKPGVWDPLIGIGWHTVGDRFEVHGVLEGGGFGVGADSDFGGGLRVDWKATKHFGLTAGYSFLKFKVTNEIAGKTLVAKQSLNGPVAGIGLYF